jgi:hypothetical protein
VSGSDAERRQIKRSSSVAEDETTGQRCHAIVTWLVNRLDRRLSATDCDLGETRAGAQLSHTPRFSCPDQRATLNVNDTELRT